MDGIMKIKYKLAKERLEMCEKKINELNDLSDKLEMAIETQEYKLFTINTNLSDEYWKQLYEMALKEKKLRNF